MYICIIFNFLEVMSSDQPRFLKLVWAYWVILVPVLLTKCNTCRRGASSVVIKGINNSIDGRVMSLYIRMDDVCMLLMGNIENLYALLAYAL